MYDEIIERLLEADSTSLSLLAVLLALAVAWRLAGQLQSVNGKGVEAARAHEVDPEKRQRLPAPKNANKKRGRVKKSHRNGEGKNRKRKRG